MHENTCSLHSLMQQFLSFLFFVHLGMNSLSFRAMEMSCLHGRHTRAVEGIRSFTVIYWMDSGSFHEVDADMFEFDWEQSSHISFEPLP